MDFSKTLRPSYLADKLLSMYLRIVLTVFFKILYIFKGEDVRIEVTMKKENEGKQYAHIIDANKVLKEKSTDLLKDLINEQKEIKKESNIVTGTPSELISKEIIKDELKEEKSEIHPFEMKTSYNNYNSDILPIEFDWKHGGQEVIITGDFDNWQGTHKMDLDPITKEFVTVINIDRTKQHEFKFIVDGDWRPNWDLPTRTDEHGNVNNLIYSLPSDPSSPRYKESSSSFSQLTVAY